MIHVVCTLWGAWPIVKKSWPESGPVWKRKGEKDWGPIYVERLRQGIIRNYHEPFRFFVITDCPDIEYSEDVIVYPLESPSWLGCLPKLDVYRPEVSEGAEQVFVFDLDTVVVGSLDRIFSYRGEFATREGFFGDNQGKSGGDLLSFSPGWGDWIYEWFQRDPGAVERDTTGRERFLYRNRVKEIDFWQRLYPGSIVSYKRHVRPHAGRWEQPPEVSLVSCHGKPRLHQIDEPWLRENWF